MSGFGANPTTGTQGSLPTNQFPLSSVAVPGTANGDLTALEGGPASTDANGNKTAPASMYVKDGSDVTQGTTTDAAVTTDAASTISAKLRGLVKISGDIWDSTNHRIRVDGSGVTQPISAASLPLPSGAATSAKQPALGTAGTASSDVITVQGIASMTALKTDGSGVTQPVSGTVAVSNFPGTQAVSGTVTANIGTTNGLALDTSINGVLVSQGSTTSGEKGPLVQGAVTTSAPTYTTAQTSPISLTTAGAVRVDGSATTQPVSAASLPLPSGASTSAKQPALGTAGSASSDVLSVQGIASMTALKTDGSGVTQPVSGAVTANQGGSNWSTNVAQIGGTNVVTGGASGLLAIGGPVASGASNADNPVKVGGAFNTTQPTVTTGQIVDAQMTARGAQIVATGVDTFTVTANAGTNLNTSALALESGGNLALAKADLDNIKTYTSAFADSSTSGTVTNDLDTVAITLPGGQATALVQITGNNVGTLLFEASPDSGTTYYPVNATAVGSSSVATQATANGAWRVNVAGFTNFHVKLHPTTSGTATIKIILSQGVHNVAVTNATALGQNVSNNSAPVVIASDQSPVATNLKQIGGNTLNAGITDGANPTNLLETALGLYTSGGPVDSTGKPQQLSFDRLRTWQGKGIGGGSTNITATVAGDTNLVFGSAPKTIMPGQAVVLAVGGGNAVEIVYVSSSYTPSSTATSIPLQAPVVLANSTTARWDTFAIGGPSTTSMLHTGLLPVMLVGYDANNGSPSAVLMASLDGRSGASILEATPGLLNTAGTVDRQRGNLDNISLLASAARTTTQTVADQTNYNGRGLIVVLDMTVAGASPSVTLEIDGKDPVSGKYYSILTGVAVTTVSTNIYKIYPGITAAANAAVSDILPRTWRVVITANNANSGTYSVGASIIV